MQFHSLPGPDAHTGKLSRRNFLTAAAAFSLAGQSLASQRERLSEKPVFAYVGTYSSPQGPEGSKGNGRGIYLFQMDVFTGALTPREVFADGMNPSWLALHPSESYLYAANETPTFQGADSGSVSAFSVDRSTGHLSLLNTVASQGAGPAHLGVHPSGKYVLVANYAGGTVAVLPIKANGELGSPTNVKQDAGGVGPPRAAQCQDLAISGSDGLAHMIQADPQGDSSWRTIMD